MAKELNFLKQLPDPLSVEVRYAEVLQFVSKLHLPDVNKEDIRRICLEGAESMDLLADQTLCVAGQEARSAWIVVAGHVTAQDINKKQRELIGHPIIIDEACLEKGEPVLSQLTVVTASTCSLIRIGKLTFASIVGMHLSSKRKDVLALSERPDQIEILSNTVSGNTQPANAAGAGAAAAAVLLNAKADPNVRAEDGSTPLHGAVERGHVQVVELLLASSVNWQSPAAGGRTPLHVAAERGFADVAEALLVSGAEPEERTEDARTALICAAARGHTLVVAKLLDYGADVQALDKMNQTALHAASVGGKAECIQLLHKKRARLEQKDGSGRTPMQLALDAKQEGSIRMLLKLRAVMPEEVAKQPEMQPLIKEVEREALLEMLKDAEVLCGKQELKEPLKIVHAWFMRSYQMLSDLEEQCRVCKLEAKKTEAKIKETEAELAKLLADHKELCKGECK
eukprot:g31929.t1